MFTSSNIMFVSGGMVRGLCLAFEHKRLIDSSLLPLPAVLIDGGVRMPASISDRVSSVPAAVPVIDASQHCYVLNSICTILIGSPAGLQQRTLKADPEACKPVGLWR